MSHNIHNAPTALVPLGGFEEFYRIGSKGAARYLRFDTFSGADIRVVLYFPPNPESYDDKRLGYFKEIANLQTITLSSHRPPIPVRRLGKASAHYARGVRTIAGTLIFNREGRDTFVDAFSRCERERIDDIPFWVDQIPPFHIVLSAVNEMGAHASAAIIDVQFTDVGGGFSIDDLVPEETYSYVARWAQPFMDRGNWQKYLHDAVAWADGAPGRKGSDLQPDTVSRDVTPHDTSTGQDDAPYLSDIFSPYYR